MMYSQTSRERQQKFITLCLTDGPRTSFHIQRTRSDSDARISPFILDPSAITNERPISSYISEALYLQTPSRLRYVNSREEALGIASYMSKLRHPNLEQFIGVIVDESISNKMIVCENHGGRSLAHYLSSSRRGRPIFSMASTLNISVQICRALVYLHSVTGQGHPSFCPHTISIDKTRSKVIVLMTKECSKCIQSSKGPSRSSDVSKVASVINKILEMNDISAYGSPPPYISSHLTKTLKSATSAGKHELSMRDLFHAVQLCLDQS